MDGQDYSLYDLSGKPESRSRPVTHADLFGAPSSSTCRPSSSSRSPPSSAKNGLTDTSDLKVDDEFGLRDLYNEDEGYTDEEEFDRKYGFLLSTNAPAEEIQGPPPAGEDQAPGEVVVAEEIQGPPAGEDQAPEAPGEVVVADPEEQGWTVVRSRKYGMIRGLHPDPEIPSPEENVCQNELKWYPRSGPVRGKKKWAQARKGGYGGSKGGVGVFVFPYRIEH